MDKVQKPSNSEYYTIVRTLQILHVSTRIWSENVKGEQLRKGAGADININIKTNLK
jgi:hypothetical protein